MTVMSHPIERMSKHQNETHFMIHSFLCVILYSQTNVINICWNKTLSVLVMHKK